VKQIFNDSKNTINENNGIGNLFDIFQINVINMRMKELFSISHSIITNLE
jgi:hypothetical protein